MPHNTGGPATRSGNPLIDGMLLGTRWIESMITYAFPGSATAYNGGQTGYPSNWHLQNFQAFSAAWSAHAVSLLAEVASFTNLSFVLGDDATSSLRWGRFDDPFNLAYAYAPGSFEHNGDQWFANNSNPNPVIGEGISHILRHELGHALGLSHPHEGQWGPIPLQYDSIEYSTMSYRQHTSQQSGDFQGSNFEQSFMLLDIAALQYLYGANFNSNATDTTYTFATTGQMFVNGVGTGVPADDVVLRTIWDGGGVDTYDFSNFTSDQTVNLEPGSWSTFSGSMLAVPLSRSAAGFPPPPSQPIYAAGNVANALLFQGDPRSLIENATTGSGNDVLTGNRANNVLISGAGNDRLFGGQGNDTLNGGAGNDVLAGGSGADIIDGGADLDTLVLDGAADLYTVVRVAGGGYHVTAAGVTDLVRNVERVSFDGGATSVSFEQFEQAAFDPYAYLVANPDIYAAYGLNTTAARAHYFGSGVNENRALGSFDPLQYIASNPDLVRAYGANAMNGAQHYLAAGRFEGRPTATFDALVYTASNRDLALAYGVNATAATTHYIVAGISEGRSTNAFDGRIYLASNRDLAQAYGDDAFGGLMHYLTSGARDGRATSSFDPLVYAASNRDLALAFHANAGAALSHYLTSGVHEGRAVASFDARLYAASNVDLARVIGLDPRSALLHYLNAGAGEGRVTTGFDAVAYLLSNEDLAGRSVSAALDHYLIAGADEGRSAFGDFGSEQTSHYTLRGADGVVGNTETRTDRDWYGAELVSGQTVTITASRFAVFLYDPEGQLVASSLPRPHTGNGHYDVVYTPANSGLYYIVVAATPTYWGAYRLHTIPGSNPSFAPSDADFDTFLYDEGTGRGSDDPLILPAGLDRDDFMVGPGHTDDVTVPELRDVEPHRWRDMWLDRIGDEVQTYPAPWVRDGYHGGVDGLDGWLI